MQAVLHLPSNLHQITYQAVVRACQSPCDDQTSKKHIKAINMKSVGQAKQHSIQGRRLTQTAYPVRSSRRLVDVSCNGTISPIGRKRGGRRERAPVSGSNPTYSSNGSSAGSSLPSRPAPSQTVSLSTSSNNESQNILSAFFYGRAFATTLSKYLGEAVVDLVAEVSKAAAERPQRLREFQEEVEFLARKEMAEASGISLPSSTSSSSNGSSSSSSSSNNRTGGSSGSAQPGPADLQVVVDDLRSEIAYSRAILQQMKTSGKLSSSSSTRPPAT